MNIAIIPARGGSKRIPRKNIKSFCGKPMIAWSIEKALDSGLFEQVIVSTDDEEIAGIASRLGASVPFLRPPELSGDFVGVGEVIAHATKWALEQDYHVDAVCCIYATAPLMQVSDIQQARDALRAGDWDYALTVTDYPAPIFRSFKRSENSGIEMFFPEHFMTRSQDLPTALHDAGQLCWGKPSAWLNGTPVFAARSVPVIVPRWRVQDIDDEDDWIRAEMMFKQIQVC